jgi:hypothetical protein
MKRIDQYGAFSVCQAASGDYVVRQDRKTIASHAHLIDAERDACTRNNAEWDAMTKMLKEMKVEGWVMMRPSVIFPICGICAWLAVGLIVYGNPIFWVWVLESAGLAVMGFLTFLKWNAWPPPNTRPP